MISSAFGQTVDNLKENYQTILAGILMTSFSMVILGSFILVYLNLIHLTQLAFRKSNYSVFLLEDVNNNQKEAILSHIRSIPNAGSVQEISSQEARRQLIDSFTEARDMLEKLDFPKFPHIIEFVLDRSSPLTVEELRQLQAYVGVQDIITGRETRDQINTFFNIANFVGIFLIGLLIVCMILIIYNTIHIAIRMRIREIEILKTLGASPGFIRLPYVLEGTLIACLSYLFSMGLIYFLFSFVVAGITFNQATYQIREMVRFFSAAEMGTLFLLFILLGIASSYLSANRIINRLDV